MATRTSRLASRPAPLDLNRLATTDPEAAHVGWALNHPAYSGVDIDGDPARLSWAEFNVAAPKFLRAYPHIAPAVQRLQAAFAARTDLGPPPANDPGAGVADIGDARGVSDSAGNENGALVYVGGPSQLLFDRADRDYTRAEVRVGAPGEASRSLLTEGGPFQLSPSYVDGNVYLVSASSMSGPAELLRVPFDGQTAGQPRKVTGFDDLSALSWPTVHALPQGGLLAAYRDGFSRPRLAYSDDGAHFVALPGTVEPAGAAMVSLGVFDDGKLAMTYQREDAGGFVSYVRTSKDGRTWSPRRPITGASTNVHDTTMVRREDGELDLYYVYTTRREGFAMYRRSLDGDGALGPEQRVTRPGPDVNKPVASRAEDGSLHVSFVEVTSRDPRGWVNGQELRTLPLAGDAPR